MPQPSRDLKPNQFRDKSENKNQRKEPVEKKLKKDKQKDHREKAGKGEKKERKLLKKETTAGRDTKQGAGPVRRPSPNNGGHGNFDGPPPYPEQGLRGQNSNAAQAKMLGAPKAGGNVAGINGKTLKGKKERAHMKWWKRMKIVIAIVFVIGYIIGVGYLTMLVVEAKSSAEEGESIEACKYLQCPSDSICVDHTGKGHVKCSENKYQNLQLLQLVLGIVVGIPAVICLPCSVQWILRTGGPSFCAWYNERKRRWRVASTAKGLQRAHSVAVSAESPRNEEDLEPGEMRDEQLGFTTDPSSKRKGGLMSMLLGRWGKKAVPMSSESLDPTSEGPNKEDGFAKPEDPVPDEDDMAMFFAPANLKNKPKSDDEAGEGGKAMAEDDFLDLIFASKREVVNAPPALPAPDDGLEPPDEDLRDDQSLGLDALFASVKVGGSPEKGKPPDKGKQANANDGQSFDDIFHRPPRRGALPPAPATAPGRGGSAMPPMPSSAPTRQKGGGDADVASRTDFSAGLSDIFGKARNDAAGSRCSAGASRVSGSLASSAQDDDDGDYDDEGEDYGEAPDFIGFALGIARQTARVDDEATSIAQGTDIFATDPRSSSAALRRDWDDRSDASGASGVDSLADLEVSPLSELFHPAL